MTDKHDLEAADLSLRQLSEQNRSRAARWHSEGDEWSGSDWSNAMCGEAGEAANVVKKLRRHETHLVREGSYNTPPEAELRKALAEELADVLLYADLLAAHYGLDLVPALIAKFNRVSVAGEFPERLSPHLQQSAQAERLAEALEAYLLAVEQSDGYDHAVQRAEAALASYRATQGEERDG